MNTIRQALSPRPYRNLVRVCDLSKPDLTREDSEWLPVGTKQFVDDICKALRCEVGFCGRLTTGRFYMYHPDDIFAMGSITVGEVTHKGVTRMYYTIESRLIENGQYTQGSRDYYRKKSTNPAVAIRNAKKYLIPLCANEVMVATVEGAHDQKNINRCKMGDARNLALSKLGLGKVANSATALMDNPTYSQLMLLRDQGVSLNPDVEAKLTEATDAHAKYRAIEDQETTFWYRHSDSKWYSRANCTSYGVYADDLIQEFAHECVPQDVKGKIDVLAVLQGGDYQPSIGYKDRSNRVFYVAD
jgi:hypothetical protein